MKKKLSEDDRRFKEIVKKHSKNPKVKKFLELCGNFYVKQFQRLCSSKLVSEYLALASSDEVQAFFDALGQVKQTEQNTCEVKNIND